MAAERRAGKRDRPRGGVRSRASVRARRRRRSQGAFRGPQSLLSPLAPEPRNVSARPPEGDPFFPTRSEAGPSTGPRERPDPNAITPGSARRGRAVVQVAGPPRPPLIPGRRASMIGVNLLHGSKPGRDFFPYKSEPGDRP